MSFWRVTFFVFTVGSVVSAAIAALRPQGDTRAMWNIFAAISAVCSGLIAVLDPADRAARYNAAVLVLKDAEFSKLERAELIKQWRRGETIINFDAVKKYLPERITEDATNPKSDNPQK